MKVSTITREAPYESPLWPPSFLPIRCGTRKAGKIPMVIPMISGVLLSNVEGAKYKIA
tara:strand:+ start:218 stop:391 length:174 start_codon:yes stop_codon:yes gene_type:complete